MRARYKKAIIAVFAGALLCVVVFVVAGVLRGTFHETRLMSAYGALHTSLIVELGSHYRENGKYPDSLNLLSDIDYSDGATPEMLSDFKYEVHGDSCSISYIFPPSGSERTTHMNSGKMTRQVFIEN